MSSFLFGASPNPTVTTSSSSSTSAPEWYQQYLAALAGKASDIAGEPYQPYTGQRVAEMTPDQQSAFDLTRSGIGSYQPMIDTANSYLTNAGGGFNQGEFDKYMSPYTDSVVNRISDLGARNLSEKLLPAVNDTFTSSGQFGSSRNADFTNRAIRDTQDAVLGAQSNALASGYNTALQGYDAGQNRTLSAGQGLSSLASTDQGLGLKDAAALDTIGQEQQGQNQKNLDIGYNDFIQQRDYPRTNVSFLNNAIRGVNPGSTTTQSGTAPLQQSQMAPSAIGQLAGVATAGLGLYGLGTKLGFFRKGGAVRRYADGGIVDRISDAITPKSMRYDTPPEPPVSPVSHADAMDERRAIAAKIEQISGDAGSSNSLLARSAAQRQINVLMQRLNELPTPGPDDQYARGGAVRGISAYARGGSVIPRRPIRVNQGTPRFQPRAYRNAISAIGAA